MANTMWPAEMTSRHAGDFRAEMRLMEFGAPYVWPTSLQSMSFRRTPRLIRRSDPEYYHLQFLLQGNIGIVQAGRETVQGPGEMTVVDTSQPYECHILSHSVGVALEIPRVLVPVSRDLTQHLLTQPLPGQEGIGALLAGFLTRLAQDTTPYPPSDRARLGTVLIDLLSATLAHHLEATDALTPETRQHTLTLRIKEFVRQHLHEPDLSPGTIAAAHHISLSHLHRLFKSESITIAALIRRQRLEGARRDLSDPALATIPIHAIATRWGFRSHADFTRSYRTAYGITPREERQR
ncbi:helix-turn-helix domain-containing protein [Streptomyces sp. TS71-3]|uniref:AraC-like ligand-binding domain-containing protein n=1 Tax=Streptomyces sp. TS71-3 TaxID=2733862 RepID=UPI00201789B9|nr:helix-turn-helix domain-containing protein [Streptomyces sp. TS71-3]